MKYHIEKNTVQETLVIPLYGRKLCSEQHPRAAVINLGCGLDNTGRMCDNGGCQIYNLDFPDVIAVRNELLPAGERERNVPCNLNDTAWFEQTDASNGEGDYAEGKAGILADHCRTAGVCAGIHPGLRRSLLRLRVQKEELIDQGSAVRQPHGAALS